MTDNKFNITEKSFYASGEVPFTPSYGKNEEERNRMFSVDVNGLLSPS